MGVTAQAGPESVTFDGGVDTIKELQVALGLATSGLAVDQAALDGLKFSAALPQELAVQVLSERGEDLATARRISAMPLHAVTEGADAPGD
jgi:hypothetical protein